VQRRWNEAIVAYFKVIFQNKWIKTCKILN
jgi:hypothetical protein